jgi:hypothetical protein
VNALEGYAKGEKGGRDMEIEGPSRIYKVEWTLAV